MVNLVGEFDALQQDSLRLFEFSQHDQCAGLIEEGEYEISCGPYLTINLYRLVQIGDCFFRSLEVHSCCGEIRKRHSKGSNILQLLERVFNLTECDIGSLI